LSRCPFRPTYKVTVDVITQSNDQLLNNLPIQHMPYQPVALTKVKISFPSFPKEMNIQTSQNRQLS
jgi:hypothetical protein